MAFEELKTAINMILDEIAKRPEDVHVLQEQLREKISELEKMGQPVPDDIRTLKEGLDDGAEDLFDNMPI